tara:strand:- start:268 stop:516 length:249 start_codon:yes stop_codon:yes gene_type:complete
MLNEYRVTRIGLYLRSANPSDMSQRQGYYIQARSEDEAKRIMLQNMIKNKRLTDADMEHGFDVQLWKRGIVPHSLSSGMAQT